MSKLLDLRKALASDIIAQDIGWTADNIIIKRQTALWNDIATAVAASKDGLALHIGVAEGQAQGDSGVGDMTLTLTLTVICVPEVDDAATPEEDVSEALMLFVDDHRIGHAHIQWAFRFRSFADVEIPSPDGGTGFLGRQMVFERKFALR